MDVKVVPNNTDAERGVIGSILIDEEVTLKVLDQIKSTDFFDPKHRTIFESIEELYRSQQPIDVLTLTSNLKKRKKTKEMGGASYIAEIIEKVPTSAHAEEYARLLKETSVRRKLIHFAGEITGLAFNESDKISDVLNKAQKSIFDISQDSIKRDFVHVAELLEVAYERAAELAHSDGDIRGIATGFGGLDNLLGGFQDSDLIILAARPSVGKSALLIDFARHAAVEASKNVAVFSLEMSNLQVMDRLLSMQVGIGLWNLRMGKLDDKHYTMLSDGMGILSESNIFIDDTPGLHINEMMTKCRRLKLEKGLDLIIIDYLQLITVDRKESRAQEVAEISRFLKILAKELNIPVLAAAQLSRAVEQRVDKRPQLSDLRESGTIEQDADIVMFLQREETHNPDTERKGIADLIVAKHRNGPTGDIELFFERELARYRQLEKKYS